MPKLSVITINLNNKEGLRGTIGSVISQKEDLEFIVIDGASEDGSAELVRSFGSNIDKFVSEKDSGIYNAQNKGISLASGEYCLFLNSGDTLEEGILKTVIPELNGTDIIYGNLYTRARGKRKALNVAPSKPDVATFMLSTLWHPSTFIRRGLFASAGLYNESFNLTGDYEFFIRAILVHNASCNRINRVIATFDTSGLSHDPARRKSQEEERYKSWLCNFSPVITEALHDKFRIERSREYKTGRVLERLLAIFGPGNK